MDKGWSAADEFSEVANFRRAGEDFYCTVDLADLEVGKPLLFFDSAYHIARAMVVATARKEAAGEVDLHKIQDRDSRECGVQSQR